MEKSILYNLYSNLCVYYLKGNYIEEARQVIKDLEKIGKTTSLFLFRKAQVLVADSRSTIEELQYAQEILKEAMEKKKTEEIFGHKNHFLKMFNLDNHQTIFNELLDKAQEREIEIESQTREAVGKVLKRAKEI